MSLVSSALAKVVAAVVIWGSLFLLSACSKPITREQMQANNVEYPADQMPEGPIENAADENGVEHHRPPREH